MPSNKVSTVKSSVLSLSEEYVEADIALPKVAADANLIPDTDFSNQHGVEDRGHVGGFL
ncbi:hypothetical protein [Kordiimonas pumila]|uniref:Uncharacterized protein n=1 Tax=Kordiimonas pumila TaxID=2161677 RepID=A0ABV7D508_9PROT|nr:hypothetical protein [Kordiimonas pumila]